MPHITSTPILSAQRYPYTEDILSPCHFLPLQQEESHTVIYCDVITQEAVPVSAQRSW